MQNALIIGPVSEGPNSKNGQTNKLIELNALLKKIYPKVNVFSTYKIKRKPFKLFSMLKAVKKANHVWFVLSRNGSMWLGPLIRFLFPRKKYYYTNVGIGTLQLEYKKSRLAKKGITMTDYLKNPYLWSKSKSQRLVWFYSKCEKLYVESDLMKRNFETVYNLANVSYLPNFRFVNSAIEVKGSCQFAKPLRLIFLSRIVPCKGVGTLIEISNALKSEGFELQVDIYGPLSQNDASWFHEIMKNANHNVVKYCGEERGDVIHRLSQYDFLIFPTESTEGMPGVIVESLFAGTPIITSDFSYANELVEDGKTGFIYCFNSKECLGSAIKTACHCSPRALEAMRRNCKKSAYKYSVNFAEKIIRKDVFENE